MATRNRGYAIGPQGRTRATGKKERAPLQNVTRNRYYNMLESRSLMHTSRFYACSCLDNRLTLNLSLLLMVQGQHVYFLHIGRGRAGESMQHSLGYWSSSCQTIQSHFQTSVMTRTSKRAVQVQGDFSPVFLKQQPAQITLSTGLLAKHLETHEVFQKQSVIQWKGRGIHCPNNSPTDYLEDSGFGLCYLSSAVFFTVKKDRGYMLQNRNKGIPQSYVWQ